MVRAGSATIEEGELRVDGVRVFYRRVAGDGTPVVYCHGNPTHGEDWMAFMRRGGAAIAIDMPGWGRSDHPDPSDFDHSMLQVVPAAGHWPWINDARVINDVSNFLS